MQDGNEGDLIRLIGLPVLVGGFLLGLRFRVPVSCIVLAAGFATGLAAGMTPREILEQLGKAFADTRTITLFVLCLPAIGLCERHGLQEQARSLIRRFAGLTVGRLQLVYQLVRIGVVTLGLRFGSGHVSFSRPIILPMSQGAAGSQDDDEIKAAVGASENYGNFFGQNLFPASAGVAIILKTLESHGHAVEATRVSRWILPVALASVAIAAVQYWRLDRRIAASRKGGRA